MQAVGVPDKPGGLSVLLKALADDGIDVLYMYSIFGQKSGKASMVFRVADQEAFDAALEKNGISAEDCGLESKN